MERTSLSLVPLRSVHLFQKSNIFLCPQMEINHPNNRISTYLCVEILVIASETISTVQRLHTLLPRE